MENASKALIIAGAILVSILLISVGVLVMQSMNPMTEQAQSQTEGMGIKTFNAQFTGYEGEGRTAAQIRALISDVKANNAVNDNVKLVKTDSATADAFTISDVSNSKKYKVTLHYNSSTGYIDYIIVAPETAT